MITLLTKTSGDDVAGRMFPIPGKQGTGVYLYNGSGSQISAGQPVMVVYAVTAGQEMKAAAPATSAFVVYTAIALENVADAAMGKFQISGLAEALVDDTSTLAAGRFLEILNAGTYLVDDGGTSRKTTSAAVLKDAVTVGEGSGSAVTKTVMLIGEPHTISAS